MAIDTLDNVKAQLGITGTADDDALTQLQAAADGFIEAFCQRTFDGGTFTEDFPGGAAVLAVRNFPVAAVTSVSVDPTRAFAAGTTLDPADYYVDPGRGTVTAVVGRFGPAGVPGAVRVVYATPTDQVPAAVTRAYADLIGHWYRQDQTHASTGQLNVLQQTSGTTVTEYPWGQSGGFRTPDGVLQLLRPYRVPSL